MRPDWTEAVDMQAHPPPLHRNPSSWSQRIPICLLAFAATLISGYMALFQMGLIDSVWDPVFGPGSEEVLKSDAAQKMDTALRLPDAALGSWAYLTEVVLGLAGCTRRWQFRPWMVILFGIDVIPLGIVSVVLVVLQGLVVGSWCFLCLVTAIISLVLVVLAYDEVWVCLKYLHRVWKVSGDRRVLWDTFCGRATPTGDALALVRS